MYITENCPTPHLGTGFTLNFLNHARTFVYLLIN